MRIVNYTPARPVDSICPNLVEADGRHLGQLAVHRTAMQISAYRAAITAMNAAPKPRIIVSLSCGVAASAAHELKEQMDSISRAAAEAGVRFYALTEIGDEFDMSLPGGKEIARRQESAFLINGVQTLASAAGGEAFLVVGTPDRFFSRIERETSGFYRIAVEAAPAPTPHRLLSAKVMVRSRDLTIRANPLAIVEGVPAEVIPIEDRLKAALAQGGASFGVPLALGTALRRDPASTTALQLSINVQVPSSVPGPLLAKFALVSEAGRFVNEGRKQVSGAGSDDYRLTLPLTIDPGQYHLRLAVADANGNVGGLEEIVRASLLRFGRFTVSDLLLSWASGNGPPHFLALETVPDSAETIRASLELYPSDPNDRSSVIVRLAASSAESVGRCPMILRVCRL